MAAIPGEIARHEVVGDQVRQERGDDVAFRIAVAALREEWMKVSRHCVVGKGWEFHVALLVDLKDRVGKNGESHAKLST